MAVGEPTSNQRSICVIWAWLASRSPTGGSPAKPDDVASLRFPFQERCEGGGKIIHSDYVRNAAEMCRSQIGRKPAPDLEARLRRAHHRVDAEQLHSAQDEWQDRRLQLGPGGQTRARDAAAVRH